MKHLTKDGAVIEIFAAAGDRVERGPLVMGLEAEREVPLEKGAG